MTTPIYAQSQTKAIFPVVPRDQKLVDNNGNITAPWQTFFQQLSQALQINYKPEGIVVPPLSATNIAQLGNTSVSVGNIIYDSTNNQFKGIIQTSMPGDPITTATMTFKLI